MDPSSNKTYTAFLESEVIASGTLSEVAIVLQRSSIETRNAMPLVFEDDSGNQVEMDLRGSAAEVMARYPDTPIAVSPALKEEKQVTSSRGRPRLGVVAREVTLLPEHWDWLASQPGGASVALRKLVHEARQSSAERDQHRLANERAYKVMVALAGNHSGFEEASRALFSGDLARLASLAKAWPTDISNYVIRLAKAGG